ncbi:hypothetical protein AG0111_0g13005 [Alternaria gaisen]|uniref:Uncharacterized protein n=1 Tax=Alternaria gaisen TaxID=167740 RepID=A0ACB6F329_9PLEO|nr:hypothetical protein AG0111_0g13005 [Alternaria gaisen]
MSPLDMDIDLMGAQPALFKLYTQLAFMFPLSESEEGQPSHHQVTSTMTAGLAELAANFPWVAGQVVNINPDTEAVPHYKIRPYEPVPQLVVRDYTGDAEIPSFDLMHQKGFPMSVLGEDVWAPCPTLAVMGFDPKKASGASDEPAPVMLVQINYAAVLGWLSQACRSEHFTENELGIGNMTRVGIVPLIEDEGWTPGPELQNQLFPPLPPTVDKEVDNTVERKSPEPPSKCAWTYFDFSAESLESLKGLATTSLPQDFTSFISTDDALSAFIFLSVLRTRQSRLRPDASVTFARAVDARRYLDIHPDYPGVLQNMAYTSYPQESLLSTPLGHIAAKMRQAVDPLASDVAYRTRSLITFLSQSPDNATKTSFTATLDMSVDIALSSWTKVPAYEWDFGLRLGPPVAVRRPGFVPVESLMYLMPRSREGSVAVAMCLREEDLQCLLRDEEWKRFARYIG